MIPCGDLVVALGGLVFLSVVFVPLERAFPARPNQPLLRPHWSVDLTFYLGQKLLWSGLVLAFLFRVRDFLSVTVAREFHETVARQPWWLQAVAVVVLSDFVTYWGHRLQHQCDFLWRFHAVHHSSEHLDWLAAHREHPVDTAYTVGLINLPAFLMGFPIETLAGLIAFRGLWAIYIHANVRLPQAR